LCPSGKENSEATKDVFFPEEVSKFGAIDDMCLHLGNYAQERITVFTDTDGKTCPFQEYLKSRGLYASRFHVYLMSTSTGNEAERSQIGDSQDEVCRNLSGNVNILLLQILSCQL